MRPFDPRDLRSHPDGLVHVRETAGRRILVEKEGPELRLLFDSVDSCEIQSRLDLDRPLALVSTYTRVALLGFSSGAYYAPAPCAVDRRIKTCILQSGGAPYPAVSAKAAV